MNCEICGTQLQALFTSNYCPNDCDKKPAKVSATAHPDTCVAIIEKQPINYKAFTRPTTELVTSYQQSLAANSKIVSDFIKANLDSYLVGSYQVHDEVCFEVDPSKIDPLEKTIYKRLRQPGKSTDLVYGNTPLAKIIKDILYYNTLKQFNAKMYSDFLYVPYDPDLCTNKQEVLASKWQSLEPKKNE